MKSFVCLCTLWVGVWLAPAVVGQPVPALYAIPQVDGLEIGNSAGATGDLDGDGVRELLLGMPAEVVPVDGEGNPSQMRLYSGRTGVLLLTITEDEILEALGQQHWLEPSRFGAAVAGLDEPGGDGFPGYAVSAPRGSQMTPGVVAVFSGPQGELLHVTTGSANGDQYGLALANVLDVNGDGSSDLLVGAPTGSGGAGYARLISGRTGATIYELDLDLSSSALFGASLAGLPDVDHGGVPDFAVGAPGIDQVIVFRGEDGSVLRRLSPAAQGSAFGASITSAVDLNGDTVRDLIVGAPNEASGRGAVYVYIRQDGVPTYVLRSTSRSSFGSTVGSAGDIDDDGLGDFVVGAPSDTPIMTGPRSVFAHVDAFSGQKGELLTRLGASISGTGLGSGLAFLGDLDGAGSDAFLIGSPGQQAGQEGVFVSGQAQVAFFAGPSSQEGFTEPTNALAGRPGGPSLVKLPVQDGHGGSHGGPTDIAFGPLVVIPRADGDSVTSAFLGDMTSEFAELEPQIVGDQPQEAVTGDFDGDGDDDYATANMGDATVTVVIEDTVTDGGTAPLQLPLGLNTQPLTLEAADINNDGFSDLQVAGSEGISSFMNDTFGDFQLVDLPSLPNVTDFELRDIDGDLDLDILAVTGSIPGLDAPGAQQPAGDINVLLGDGLGHFTLSATFDSGPPKVSLEVGDLDLDGDEDMLVTTHQVVSDLPQARVEAWLNNGSGVFTLAPGVEAIVQSNPTGVVLSFGTLADINRDGLLDAVFTSNENIASPPGSSDDITPPLTVTIMINQGDDMAGVWQGFDVDVLGTAYAGKAVEPILVDVFTDPAQPGDVDPDLILVWFVDELSGISPVPQEVAFIGLLLGDGAGSFFDPSPNQFVLDDQPGDGDAGEMGDGDGGDGSGGSSAAVDLVFPNLVSNSLSVIFGDGDGGIQSMTTIEDIDALDPTLLPHGVWSGGPRLVRIAPLDGDDLNDVMVYNEWRDAVFGQATASLTLLLNDGAGGLTVSDYLTMERAGDCEVFDLDSDGDMDVVATQRIGGNEEHTLLIFRGLGNGQLEHTPTVHSVPGRELTGGLDVENLIVNGALPGAVTSARDAKTQSSLLVTYLLRENHILEVIESPMVTAWSSVESLVLHDIDLDGFVDAVVGTTAGTLIVALGNGDGSFTESLINPTTALVGGGELAVGLLDSDKLPDIVSSKGTQAPLAGVHVLTALGQADFLADSLAGISASGLLGAQRPVIVDFNGDGTQDMVLSHGTSNTISILLNMAQQVEVISEGTPGSGGVKPSLQVSGYTSPGATMILTAGDALGGAAAVLFIGTQPLPGELLAMGQVAAQLPLVLGGIQGTPGGSGEQLIAVRVPANPDLLGLETLFQVLVKDPGAPTGIAASDALQITMVP